MHAIWYGPVNAFTAKMFAFVCNTTSSQPGYVIQFSVANWFWSVVEERSHQINILCKLILFSQYLGFGFICMFFSTICQKCIYEFSMQHTAHTCIITLFVIIEFNVYCTHFGTYYRLQ